MKLKNWCLVTMTIILMGCAPTNAPPKVIASENNDMATVHSSEAQNRIDMTASPHFDHFEVLIANLKSYYSSLDLSQKQLDRINDYLARAELDSLEKDAFAYNQEAFIRNIKHALNDFVNMEDSMLSESVTQTEHGALTNMVENLVKSNIVHGFNNPTQVNPYNLISYCAYKRNTLSISAQEIAEVLMQDFGSAFLVYPLPESFSFVKMSADWEISNPPIVTKKQQQYHAAVSISKPIDNQAIEIHIVYIFKKQGENYQIVSSHLKQF